jgi:hypothetical protein
VARQKKELQDRLDKELDQTTLLPVVNKDYRGNPLSDQLKHVLEQRRQTAVAVALSQSGLAKVIKVGVEDSYKGDRAGLQRGSNIVKPVFKLVFKGRGGRT